jgi:hypothetical protein
MRVVSHPITQIALRAYRMSPAYDIDAANIPLPQLLQLSCTHVGHDCRLLPRSKLEWVGGRLGASARRRAHRNTCSSPYSRSATRPAIATQLMSS